MTRALVKKGGANITSALKSIDTQGFNYRSICGSAERRRLTVIARAGRRNTSDPKTHIYHGGEYLIRQRRYFKPIRMPGVIGIDRTVAEREESREQGIYHIRRDEVEQQRPANPATVGPRPQDAPPEQKRGAEKREMLNIVPSFLFQSKVVGTGNVPSEKGEIHREPCHCGADEPMPRFAKR